MLCNGFADPSVFGGPVGVPNSPRKRHTVTVLVGDSRRMGDSVRSKSGANRISCQSAASAAVEVSPRAIPSMEPYSAACASAPLQRAIEIASPTVAEDRISARSDKIAPTATPTTTLRGTLSPDFSTQSPPLTAKWYRNSTDRTCCYRQPWRPCRSSPKMRRCSSGIPEDRC